MYHTAQRTACCRCQKTVEETDNGDEKNYILPCASCTKSAHEYGCATQEKTVIGQYWQCKKCRSRRQDIHPAYKVLPTNKFENVHRKRISQMSTMAHWKNQGTYIKHRLREFDRYTHTSNDWKDDMAAKQINNRGIRTHIKQLIQNEGDIVKVIDYEYCMYRAIGKILQKQPGEMMQEVRAHMLSMDSCTEYYLEDEK